MVYSINGFDILFRIYLICFGELPFPTNMIPNTVAAHAASIINQYPGFAKGIPAAHRYNGRKKAVIISVFNRDIDEDSGLRFKVLLPDGQVDTVEGRLNLFGALGDNEIVISKTDYPRAFTVRDICNGMLFERGTVLSERESCIAAGSLPVDMVGMYILDYYVNEVRAMFVQGEEVNNVYQEHSPIFENVCGYIQLECGVSNQVCTQDEKVHTFMFILCST
jgi:hypothetical protein